LGDALSGNEKKGTQKRERDDVVRLFRTSLRGATLNGDKSMSGKKEEVTPMFTASIFRRRADLAGSVVGSKRIVTARDRDDNEAAGGRKVPGGNAARGGSCFTMVGGGFGSRARESCNKHPGGQEKKPPTSLNRWKRGWTKDHKSRLGFVVNHVRTSQRTLPLEQWRALELVVVYGSCQWRS